MIELALTYFACGLVGALSVILTHRVEFEQRMNSSDELATALIFLFLWPIIIVFMACEVK